MQSNLQTKGSKMDEKWLQKDKYPERNQRGSDTASHFLVKHCGNFYLFLLNKNGARSAHI